MRRAASIFSVALLLLTDRTLASWESGFGAPGASEPMDAIAGSGSEIFIGGMAGFEQYELIGSVRIRGLAHFDGSKWDAMGGGIQGVGRIHVITPASSTVYFGGWFTNISGTPLHHIASWSSGQWTPIAGLEDSDEVRDIQISGSQLIVAGSLGLPGDARRYAVAVRTGTQWNPLNSVMADSGEGSPWHARTIALEGTNLYVAGLFSTIGGVAANNIARWNGQTWEGLGSGLNDAAHQMTFFNGKLYVVGSFTGAGGMSATNVAIWDGSSWSALPSDQPKYFGALSPEARSIATSGSRLYIAGQFSQLGNVAATNIIQFDGRDWTPAVNWPASAEGNSVTRISPGANADLLVAGSFHSVTGAEILNLGKVTQGNLAPVSEFGNGKEPVPRQLVPCFGGVVSLSNLVREEPSYTSKRWLHWFEDQWAAIPGPPFARLITLRSGFLDTLECRGTNIYAARGVSATADGTNVHRWNGQGWSPIGALNEHVLSLLWTGNQLFAGGRFTAAGTRPANRVARYDGSTWTNVGKGFNLEVDQLVSFKGQIVASGLFTALSDGTPMPGISAWDGTNWNALGSGLSDSSGRIRKLFVLGDNLYVAGHFHSIGGIAAENIARWDGLQWSPLTESGFNGVDQEIFDLNALGSDLLVSGAFRKAGGKPASCLARWNGSRWTALADVKAIDGHPFILSMAPWQGGFLMSGNFQEVDAIISYNVGFWYPSDASIRANDDFYHRTSLAAPATIRIDSGSFSRESSEPAHAGEKGGKSAWWSFTPSRRGILKCSTAGSGFDTLLAVYTGQALASLQEIASNDDFPGEGLTSAVKFIAEPGVEYQIAVDGFDGAFGELALAVDFLEAEFPSVPNDLFANRRAVQGMPAMEWGCNVSAGLETGESILFPAESGNSVWWKWTVPKDASYIITTEGTDFPATLAAFTGTSLSQLALQASSRAAPDGRTNAAIVISGKSGDTYALRVDGLNRRSGNILLTVYSPDGTPSHSRGDYFDFRLPETGRVHLSSTNATHENGEPFHANIPGAHSLWWYWIAPAAGKVRFSTAGSDFDTTLGIYTGTSVNTLQSAGSNNDEQIGVRTSEATVDAVAGTPLAIAVDGVATASGNVTLDFAFTPAASSLASNDHFGNRLVLSGASVSVSADNHFATRELSEPSLPELPAGSSLWWSWTAPGDGTLDLSTARSNFDTILAVFQGGSFRNLGLIGVDDDSSGSWTSHLRVPVESGGVYLISVSGAFGSLGAVGLDLAFTPGNPIGRPANDDFSNAATLFGFAPKEIENNEQAISETNEPSHAGNLAYHSLWWVWRAPTTGKVTIDTEGSSFPTVLAVYTGPSLTTLQAVASSPGIEGVNGSARVEFNASEGTIYRIAVDGMNAAFGEVHLQLEASNQEVHTSFYKVERLSANELRFYFNSLQGVRSLIQASDDLEQWTTVGESYDPSFYYREPDILSFPRRFYRVVIP